MTCPSAPLQVSLVPPAPVLPPGMTTPLEVRFRPLLVGSSEASLKLDSTELGLYDWQLKLTGAPTMPERPLAFSVPLGTREVQVRGVTQAGCMSAVWLAGWVASRLLVHVRPASRHITADSLLVCVTGAALHSLAARQGRVQVQLQEQ